MAETAQRFLGQLADGRFPLRKLLGVSPNSAVFLTSLAPTGPGDPSPDAAIKLIPEDDANSDLQLERWSAAAALSHPGLLGILHSGRCNIDGSPCLYIVTELADEDLGQLLPTRALTPDETRGMLAPVLSALDFLHESGFVHAGLKPSNIHAIADNVKLSADRILAAGESSSSWALAAPYGAPESVLFPASDVWSLGVSLCETLSRTFPVREFSGQFTLPELSAPFSEIVRAALVEDATLRITLDQARLLLDPSFVPKRKPVLAAVPASVPASASVDAPSPVGVAAALPDSPEALIAAVQPAVAHAAKSQAAAATGSSSAAQRQPLPQIDPLAVPLSPISPNAATPPARTRIPVSSLPQVNATIAGPRRVSTPPKSSSSNTLVLVGAAAAILLAILFIPRYFLRSTKPSTSKSASSNVASSSPENSAAAKTPSTSSSSSSTSGPTNPPPASKSATGTISSRPASDTVTTPTKKSGSSDSTAAAPASGSANSPSAASRSAVTSPAGATTYHPASPNVNPLAPTVLRKILPVVSEKARATINGTVRINVRVQLNPDGTVSTAELANPASSQFFADLALKAAQQWQFGPPSSDDSGAVPSSAVIRFDFTQITTSAYLP
jgi:TonB family protein